jgi:hypothetical protein
MVCFAGFDQQLSLSGGKQLPRFSEFAVQW